MKKLRFIYSVPVFELLAFALFILILAGGG